MIEIHSWSTPPSSTCLGVVAYSVYHKGDRSTSIDVKSRKSTKTGDQQRKVKMIPNTRYCVWDRRRKNMKLRKMAENEEIPDLTAK